VLGLLTIRTERRGAVPTATIDGIPTHYELVGSGPPLLMFSPGGFNATLANWRTQGIYRRLGLLDRLAARYTCIVFDKRESGESGGRLEQIGWLDYAAQGQGLLEHLGIERSHLMGGCVGCSIAATLAVARPEVVLSLVLYSPAGGPKYRITQHSRFDEHLAYVEQHGLPAAVELGRGSDKSFSEDPRVGPWVSVIRRDPAFADEYAGFGTHRYVAIVSAMKGDLFDRDTAPGPAPEELLRLDVPALVVPGQDASHATSAARYLEECLSHADYWDAKVDEQTEQTTPARVLEFLDQV
jgi:pimeloyl-ACP methyl ester carboxylesterase